MAELVSATIDGKTIQVKRDTTVLKAAQELGIEIPTLCHNDNLEPYGVCRFCIVEIKEGTRTRIAPACIYPIRADGTVINTKSDRVLQHRKMILTLLLARCPNVEVLWELAKDYGIKEIPARLKKQNDDCILCGLCVRACKELVGLNAIGFEERGTKRRVVAPFDEEYSECIACGTCSYICPTDAIQLIDEGNKRRLPRWHREVSFIECEKCKRPFAPWEQLEIFAKRTGVDASFFKICPDCRK